MIKFKVSKTYQTTTPESRTHGDFAEDGFVYEDKLMSLRELMSEVEDLGYCEWSSSRPQIGDWLSQVDPYLDIYDGTETSESLHFTDGLKQHQVERLVRIMRGK
jgi:hypothetical protein